MATTQCVEVKKQILEILAQRDQGVDGVPIPSRTTAAGSTTTLKDRVLGRGTGAEGRFDGRLIEIIEDTSAAYTNPAAVKAATAHTATVTTLQLDDAQDIEVGHVILVNSIEKMLVTNIATNNLTVVRGYAGSTAAALTGSEAVEFVFQGAIVGVDDKGSNETDQLTVSPALPVAAPIGMQYLMYPRGLTPETLLRDMNRALRATDMPYLWAPSLVPDSDLDDDDITAYWNDVGSPSSVAFVTSGVSGWSLFGERMIQFLTNAADIGTQSDAFNVHPSETFLVSVHGREAAAKKFRVELREQSSGDVVDYADIASTALTEARFTATWASAITTQEDQGNIALIAQISSANGFQVAAPIIVQSDRRRTYVAPSWFTRESQFRGAFYLPAGAGVENPDGYVALGALSVPFTGVRFLRSGRALAPLRVEFEPNLGRGPVFLECWRPFAELSYDTETTPCDPEYLKYKTIALILRDRGSEGADDFEDKAMKRAALMGYGQRELRLEQAEAYV